MREIPSSLNSKVVAEIDARLAGVAAEYDVTIPLAIESGSRAWGFPSPDSDYDCRFIYVRRPDAYLSLWQSRDVIDTPLDKVFDVNGWDVAKALKLLVKGNATVIEWLQSPIVYAGDEGFRTRMLALAAQVADPILLSRHYLHTGRNQWDDESPVPIKRSFYALRSAASLRWLRVRAGEGVPPMNLHELLGECEPPSGVVEASDALTALKAVTRELGVGEVPASIARFIREEFALAEQFDSASQEPPAERAALADEFFRSLLR